MVLITGTIFNKANNFNKVLVYVINTDGNWAAKAFLAKMAVPNEWV